MPPAGACPAGEPAAGRQGCLRAPPLAQPHFGSDTARAARAGTCHCPATALCWEILCSVTAALLFVARERWYLFVASGISQRFLPVTTPSTSTEDVGHFLAYRRSKLSGERRGP